MRCAKSPMGPAIGVRAVRGGARIGGQGIGSLRTMMRFWKKAEGGTSGSRGRRSRNRPSLESLERRELLAGTQPYVLTGDRWSNATPITYSIAADVVTWDHGPNVLNAALNARIASSTWQREIARALQTWASAADIDFVRVADSGHSFDALGKPQGDLRFGDIRFGGYDFGNTTQLAHAYTPPPNGSTAAGDVAVNTAMTYNVGSQYDLYSVLLHETGHSLGLEHPDNTGAVMRATYGGVLAGLEADDIAGIRAIYGARADDVYGQQGKGAGLSDAVDVSPVPGLPSEFALGDLALTTIGDSDYFSVVAPTSGASLRVTAIAAGVSLLSAQVSVYDASGTLLATGGNASDYGLDVTASVAGVVAGQRYYIKVSGATGDVFSVGTYGLRVGFEGGQPLGIPIPPLVTNVVTPTPVVPAPFTPPASPPVAPPYVPPYVPPYEPPSVSPSTPPDQPAATPVNSSGFKQSKKSQRPMLQARWRRRMPRFPGGLRFQAAARLR